MRRLLVLAVALVWAAPAQAATGQDFEGSWAPPPITSSYYRVTTEDVGERFEGRLTRGGAIERCTGGPDVGDVFWTAKQEGSLNGGAIYDGRTFNFRLDAERQDCEARMVRAKFWPLVDDRLRICPAPFETPDAEPVLDTTAPVDQSMTCTDFDRTDDPLTPKAHRARDYIPKITRDDNRCKTDYNVALRYVADDPMIRVRIFLKRTAGARYRRFPNNERFLPRRTDAAKTRVLDFRRVEKGPLYLQVRIRTQSGKTFKRTRRFSACRG